jgi:hypothetical protein
MLWAIPFRNAAYSTTFSGAPENPISEGGVWFHTRLNNAFIATVTSPNRAVGTQPGGQVLSGDSFAYLSRFNPNVSAQATIYKDPTIDTITGEHEIELLLRMVDTSTTSCGYECNMSSVGAYSQIVRWDPTSFTYLAGQFSSSFSPAPVTGDIFIATIVGGTITTYISRLSGGGPVQLQQATDNTYPDGQPGIGMWLADAAQVANQPKFGFTSYSVKQI